jgi:hypothetical protein
VPNFTVAGCRAETGSRKFLVSSDWYLSARAEDGGLSEKAWVCFRKAGTSKGVSSEEFPNARPEADEPRCGEKIFHQKNTFG